MLASNVISTSSKAIRDYFKNPHFFANIDEVYLHHQRTLMRLNQACTMQTLIVAPDYSTAR
jgi:5'(3')-deoxyribonucleotidase